MTTEQGEYPYINENLILQAETSYQMKTTQNTHASTKTPAKSNSGRWTKEQHLKFVESLSLYGQNWKKVQEYVATRTGAQIRSHAQKFFIHIDKQVMKQNQLSQQVEQDNIQSDQQQPPSTTKQQNPKQKRQSSQQSNNFSYSNKEDTGLASEEQIQNQHVESFSQNQSFMKNQLEMWLCQFKRSIGEIESQLEKRKFKFDCQTNRYIIGELENRLGCLKQIVNYCEAYQGQRDFPHSGNHFSPIFHDKYSDSLSPVESDNLNMSYDPFNHEEDYEFQPQRSFFYYLIEQYGQPLLTNKISENEFLDLSTIEIKEGISEKPKSRQSSFTQDELSLAQVNEVDEFQELFGDSYLHSLENKRKQLKINEETFVNKKIKQEDSNIPQFTERKRKYTI